MSDYDGLCPCCGEIECDYRDDVFVTVMHDCHRPLMEKALERFPEQVRLHDITYKRDGQVRPGYFSVTIGPKSTGDLTEFWNYYDSLT